MSDKPDNPSPREFLHRRQREKQRVAEDAGEAHLLENARRQMRANIEAEARKVLQDLEDDLASIPCGDSEREQLEAAVTKQAALVAGLDTESLWESSISDAVYRASDWQDLGRWADARIEGLLIEEAALPSVEDSAPAAIASSSPAGAPVSKRQGGRPKVVTIDGQVITQRRGKRSRKQFAGLIGISRDLLTRAEKGEASEDTITKLEGYLVTPLRRA